MWLRRIASRRSPSMVASASWPARTSPLRRALCATKPGTARTVSKTSAMPGLGHDGAGVADLAAALGVEGRAVEEDLDQRLAAGLAAIGFGRQHGDDLRRHLVVPLAPADERRRPLRLEQLPVHGLVTRPRRLGRRPGPLALLGHGGVEAGPVDLHPRVACQLLGQLDRKAVGVVQGEGHVAIQHLGPGAQRLLQAAQPGAQGPVEPGLLPRHDVDDEVVVLHELGIGLAQHLGGGVDQRGADGLVDPEAPRRHHGAAHDAAQHVAPALVGGQHPVGDEHGHGAPVVGQHAECDVTAQVGAVRRPQDGGRRVDDRPEQVGVEDGIVTLEDGEDPLEAGAGVDVLARQLGELALRVAVELHEDEVPDLDEALVAAVLGSAVVPVRLPLVEEELRIGAAGSRVAHGPEVVLVAHALDPLGPHADLVDPELLGFVVGLVHGHPEAIAVEAEDLGEELPGHRDGVRLEVVPEAEVAEHLEEGAVVGVGADDVDVGRAEALLNRGCPGPRRRLLAQEVRLEGHHAGDREEDRRIVRDEAGRRDDHVAPIGEVAREGRPESVGVHRSSLPGAKTASGPGGAAENRGRDAPAQADDIPTMGWLSRMEPVDPKNGASP